MMAMTSIVFMLLTLFLRQWHVLASSLTRAPVNRFFGNVDRNLSKSPSSVTCLLTRSCQRGRECAREYKRNSVSFSFPHKYECKISGCHKISGGERTKILHMSNQYEDQERVPSRGPFRKDKKTRIDKPVKKPISYRKNFTSLNRDKLNSSRMMHRRYFATCIPGLETILGEELSDPQGHIRADDVVVERSGVYFSEHEKNSWEVGYRALLWSRVAHRVLELIFTNEFDDSGTLQTPEDLYDYTQKNVNVEKMFSGKDDRGDRILSLSVKCNIGGYLPKGLSHSHYTALTVKNAFVDAVRNSHHFEGFRPDVDTDDADLPFVLALKGPSGREYNNESAGNDGVTVSLYRSLGGQKSLHRRGYRRDTAIHKAAMKETMAAGLLYAAGWNRLVDAAKADGQGAVLLDPMAGSGTFCFEAALIAADVAPGLVRQRAGGKGYVPAALRWGNADWKCWHSLISESIQCEKKGMEWIHSTNGKGRRNCVIAGNDVYNEAVYLSESCRDQMNMENAIHLECGNCRNWRPRERNIIEGRTIVVTNPPWGLRLTEDVTDSWSELKDFFQRECGGIEAWVLSGNKDLTRILRMKKSRSIPLNTADENLRWLQYHIFERSKPLGENDT